MNYKKYDFKSFFITLIAIFLGAAFLSFSGIGCVFRYFFNIPCPGCGMTRAFISLLSFDIKAAFSFHPMFFAVPVILLYILFHGKLFKKIFLNYFVLSLIAIGFIINYVFVLTQY